MRDLLLVLLLASLTVSYNIRENHQYWYTANKAGAQTGIPYADVAWNYCDYKCTSFEHVVQGVDFFVITFSQGTVSPNFAACYGRNQAGQVQLWKQYTSNSWYDTNCGGDTEDYYTNTNKYSQVSQEGVGFGSLFTY